MKHGGACRAGERSTGGRRDQGRQVAAAAGPPGCGQDHGSTGNCTHAFRAGHWQAHRHH